MNVRKRGLALLMCICMIFTLLPFSVFAEDGAEGGNESLVLDDVIIVDSIGTDGRFILKATDAQDNELTAAALSAAGYTISWTKDGTAVTRTKVSGENYNMAEDGSWVNVAYDNGARKTYTVTVSKGDVNKSASKLVEWYDALQNTSFESPNILSETISGIWYGNGGIVQTSQENVPFWSTTASNRNIELGNMKKAGTHTMYNCDTAADGDQVAELNCDSEGALYQDVLTTPGATMHWNLSHRGRNGTDMMALVIAPLTGENGAQNITEQKDLEDYIETNKNNPDVKIVYMEDGQRWETKTGTFVIPEGQYLTRFFFVAISTSTGDLKEGNLLDNAWFSTENVPPATGQGQLVIKKTIVGLNRTEAQTLIETEGLITYEVGDGEAQNASFSTLTENEDGSFTAEFAVNIDVPANGSAAVTVKENEKLAEVAGYNFKTSDVPQTVCIAEKETETVSITNTYSTQEGTITITKSVEGLSDAEKPDSFTFHIMKGDEIAGTVTVSKNTNGGYDPGKITLPYGTYTIKEAAAKVEGYDCDTSFTVGSNSDKNEISIDKENSDIKVNVLNEYSPKPGTLVVKKTVSGNVSTSKEFEFEVTIEGENKALPRIANNFAPANNTNTIDYNALSFDNSGEATVKFTLKDGETYTITNLPANTKYTVKELDSSDYTVTATVNGKETAIREGSFYGCIAAGDTTTVSFNNYKAYPPTPTPKTALTITAGSAEGYGPDPVTCDKWTVEGLKDGDSVDSVTITGKQSVPGSSANVASAAVIKNAAGQDVTASYDIKYVDGTLTMIEILNKEIHFNYIVGYTDGTIRPENNISRAEIAAIFFRLLNDDVRDKFNTTDCDFSDVAEGSWCRRSIATLTSLGVISGYTDGTFRPDAEITRAELATIISRFANLDVNTQTFSDISGHWAQKYIELAAGNGWIKGYDDGTFRPDNQIIRAETFAMINRVLNRQTENVTDLLPQSEMNMWSDNMDEDAWYYKDVQEATNYHKCERIGDSIYEKWTEKVTDIDWAKIQL